MDRSKFEELRSKAEEWCREFDRYKEECKLFAEKLRVELIEYLGATSSDVEFHVLDEHLERKPDEGTTLSPRMQVGYDGLVYFGLTIFFQLKAKCLDEHIRVGVQRHRSQWRVRWNHMEIPYDGPKFFDKVVGAIAEKFSTPLHRRRGMLGFVPIVTNDHLALVPPAELRAMKEATQPVARNESSTGDERL